MKGLLAAIATALLVAACGSVATGAGPTPTPTVGPGLGFDVVVTEKDHTASLRVGQKMELVLRAANGMTNWNGVRSSDTSVLQPIPNPAATAAVGVTLAAFKAAATGQVDITAVAGASCSPGQACPMFAVLYSVRVTVTP